MKRKLSKKKIATKITRKKEPPSGEIRVPHWMQPGSTRDLPWHMQKKRAKKSR